MYARNAASPEPIAIGAVVQISDGAVQTSGCTVRIKPIGVAEGDGGGTTAYSTDGIVLYTPTQAETNYTSFILIAKKTGCIPACVTVVTTASSVSGRTVPADGSITAAVIADNAIDTATFASGTTLPRVTLVDTTTTNADMRGTDGANTTTPPTVSAIANEVQARTIARVTLVDTCTTNSDMRGTDNAALAATALSTATWTNGLATNLGTTNSTVATNLDATVSSRLASASYTAPANSTIADLSTRIPAALVGGKMSSIAELDSASIDAIWNEVLTGATHNIASSAGRRLRQLADTVVLVDGVCDAASNAGTDSTGTITLEVGTTTACVGQAIRCENQVRFIASYNAGTRVAQLDRPWCVVPDAGDEYVIFNVRNPLVGLASLALAGSTAAVVNDVNAVTEKVDTGLVLDGAVYQFTANMLELGPSGGGGGSGDATLAKQEEILTQLDVIQTKTDTIGSVGAITSLLAAAVLEPGTITSFPETLTIGDSYTEQNGREIQIPIVNTDGTPLSSTGSLNFADASVTFTLQRSGETDSTRVITGTATFVDPPGTGTGAGAPYAVIELPASETAKGLKKYKYSGILTFTWAYAGTGTADDVMSFETDTVTFDN
jgi:hypothetical protein